MFVCLQKHLDTFQVKGGGEEKLTVWVDLSCHILPFSGVSEHKGWRLSNVVSLLILLCPEVFTLVALL